MKLFIIAGLFCVVLMATAVVGVPYVLEQNSGNTNVDRNMAVAGLIVSGATLASVMFAVITYLESVVLSERMTSVAEDYESFRIKSEDALSKMNDEFKERLYRLSLVSFEGLYDFAMNLPNENESFEQVCKSLRSAELEVHLARGSYMAAFKAMEIGLKDSPKTLLKMERRLIEVGLTLDGDERERLGDHFENLKEVALRQLDST